LGEHRQDQFGRFACSSTPTRLVDCRRQAGYRKKSSGPAESRGAPGRCSDEGRASEWR